MQNVYKEIAKGLKGHHEGLLLFGLTLIGMTGFSVNVDALYAAGFPGGMYLMYVGRMYMHSRHLKQMAEMEVNRLEKDQGVKSRKRISDRRNKQKTK